MFYERYSLRNIAQKNVTARSAYFSVESGDELNSLETYVKHSDMDTFWFLQTYLLVAASRAGEMTRAQFFVRQLG